MKRVPLLFITQSRRNPVSLPGFAIRLAKSEHNPHVQIDPVVLKLLNAKGSQFCSGTNVVHRRHTRAVGSFTCSNSGRFTDDEFTTNWARDFHGNIEKSAVRFFFSNSGSLRPFGAPASKTDHGFACRVRLCRAHHDPHHDESRSERRDGIRLCQRQYRFAHQRVLEHGCFQAAPDWR